MRSIAVINQKGGVGKTTTVANLGVALGALGRRVLLVDLDPQAHLSLHMGLPVDGSTPSSYTVLTGQSTLKEAIIKDREGVDVLGSTIDLAAAEIELVSIVGREVLLRDALGEVSDAYDIILVDCPPSLGVLTLNALAAVEEIMIPLQPHFLALQGVGKLLETVSLVAQRLSPKLRVSGILLAMYEATTRLTGEVIADITSFLEQYRGQDVPWRDAQVYQTVIRRNIRLAESPSHGRSVFGYAPSCPGARDYAQFARELLGLTDERAGGETVEEQTTAVANPPPDTARGEAASSAGGGDDGAAAKRTPAAQGKAAVRRKKARTVPTDEADETIATTCP